ncbi:MAG: hypothetical protein AAFP89_04620 [Bacteroidota bacterium]
MKIKLLILFLLVGVSSQQARGQVLRQRGYVAQSPGDTIQGTIKVRAWHLMNQKVLFRPNGKLAFQTYTADEIEGYGFSRFEFIKRKTIVPKKDLLITDAEEKEVFLLRCNEGPLDLYEYRVGYKKVYYLESEAITLVPLIYNLQQVEGVEIDLTRATATFPNGKVVPLVFAQKIQKDAFGQEYLLNEEKTSLAVRENQGVEILYKEFDRLDEIQSLDYPQDFKMRYPMIARSVDEVNLQIDSSRTNMPKLNLKKHYVGPIGAVAYDYTQYSEAPAFAGLAYEYRDFRKWPRLSLRLYLGYFEGLTRDLPYARFYDYDFEEQLGLEVQQLNLGGEVNYCLFPEGRINPSVGIGALIRIFNEENNTDIEPGFFNYEFLSPGFYPFNTYLNVGLNIATFRNQFLRIEYFQFPTVRGIRKPTDKFAISYMIPLNR